MLTSPAANAFVIYLKLLLGILHVCVLFLFAWCMVQIEYFYGLALMFNLDYVNKKIYRITSRGTPQLYAHIDLIEISTVHDKQKIAY